MASGTGEPGRGALHVIARSGKQDRWLDLQFITDDTDGLRIRQMVFVAWVSEPVALPPGSIDQPGTLRWLNEYVDRLVRSDDLSGGLLIARGNDVLVERAFGHADAKRSVPVTTDTRFGMASGSKMFTAVAAALLVDESRLRFDSTIEQWMPELADAPQLRRTSVGQLLSHTAGLGEFWTDEYARERSRLGGMEDVLPYVLKAGYAFEPGTAYAYSNSNFLVAGFVVARASGESYYDFVQARILDPLGMSATGWQTAKQRRPGDARPLTGKPKAWREAPAAERGTSAGGATTTMADMLRWSRGLFHGSLLPPETVRELIAPRNLAFTGRSEDYGYGFIRQRNAGVDSFGHGGTAPGTGFEFRWFPREDITLVVWTNQDNGAYDDLRRNAIKLITGDR